MEKIKLLLVEDDADLLFMVKGTFELNGNYEIYTATNGEEGLEIFHKTHPDVIVADVEMPKMSGFEMVKLIRETDAQILIIFASARKTPQDFIEGLEVGADNFIRKPYLPQELDTQIKVLLRRVKGKSVSSENTDIYHLGNYEFNAQFRTLQIKEQAEILRLTEREVKILKILLEKEGQLVTRDEILTPIWETIDFYVNRSLDVFMTKIRKYLKKDESIQIQTIRGEGFRLVIKRNNSV